MVEEKSLAGILGAPSTSSDPRRPKSLVESPLVQGGPTNLISSLDTRFATVRSHAFGDDASMHFDLCHSPFAFIT